MYDEIIRWLNTDEKLSCEKIFDTFTKPPYGMSEDIITMMIAVVCANLSYCLRFSYNGSTTNIGTWKDLVVKKDKKIETVVIKQSEIIVVDAGEVVSRYKRIFTRIQDNRLITEINALTEELQQMVVMDEVPSEIETDYLLAKNILDKGIKAQNEWNSKLREVRSLYNEAVDGKNLYNALKGLESMQTLPIKKCFYDNGFDFDKVSERKVNDVKSDLTSFVYNEIDDYVKNMYCKDVEHLASFRNHNNRLIELLQKLGFQNYAKLVNDRKNQELANIEEIRSRQELKNDCKKFLEESTITRSTPYVAIKDLAKQGKELQARIEKYGTALGKDGVNIQGHIDSRIQELNTARNRIEGDITEIWDDLPLVKSADDIQDLIERINIVVQKGLESRDSSALEEIKANLEEFIVDIKRLNNTEVSRVMLEKVSNELRSKYCESDFDFEVTEILESIIREVIQKMDDNDARWRRENLTLGTKTRDEVHKWKEKTRYLPEYLSDSTLYDVERLDKEADEIIKIGKIEDVVFYFEKLTDEEKSLCLKRLTQLI